MLLTRFGGLTILIFCLTLLTSTFMTLFQHKHIDRALIISSNHQDYDQALYLMLPDGESFKRLTDIPGSEEVVSISKSGRWLLIRSLVNKRFYSVDVASANVAVR